MKHLNNAREVIDALGGPDRLARALKLNAKTTALWRTSYKPISARYYVRMIELLAELPEPCTASPHLWGMLSVGPNADEAA